MIDTPRTRLRPWQEADREVFAVLHADAKLDRYRAAFDCRGLCRWAIESREGGFLGYAGVMPVGGMHPLGPHLNIG